MKFLQAYLTQVIVVTGIAMLFLGACNNKPNYRFATAAKGATYNRIAHSINEIARAEGVAEFEILEHVGLGSITNCQMIAKGDAEFAIAQNDTPIEQIIGQQKDHGLHPIRTVMPLYPEVCYIIYPDSLQPKSLRELIEGRRIGIGPKTSGTARFMMILFRNYGLDTTDYTPVFTTFAGDTLGSHIDVSCSLTGFNNPKIPRMLNNGGRIFSLDDFRLRGLGSSVEGFCLNYPRAHPFTIPRNTYGRYPAEPILTVAVDAMLLAHRDVDPTVVSELIRVIIEDKPMLSHYNTLLGQISDDFDFSGLDFPLHPGAVQYLERDKPTFLERYAEVLALFVTLMVVSAGGYRRYQQRVNQQKKDRIDVYYKKLLEIERDAPSLNTVAEIEAMEDRIQQLRRHAFDALIVERLRADESFRIFVTLSNDVLRELERRKFRLQDRAHLPPQSGGERSDE